ncbi:hypothetical protein CPER28S_02852 [Cellulomonas persica]
MCRSRVESMSGSYVGRIAPPGIPKTTSAPTSSSERTIDCAPVTCSTTVADEACEAVGVGAAGRAVAPTTAGLTGVRGGAGWGPWTIGVSLLLT